MTRTRRTVSVALAGLLISAGLYMLFFLYLGQPAARGVILFSSLTMIVVGSIWAISDLFGR